MKQKTKIFWLLILLSSLLSGRVWARVFHSYHDMYYQGKGTDPNICSYCHIPHNAAGEMIWSKWANEARLTGSYTRIGNMCFTCHDGTVTDRGVGRVFSTYWQQHKIPEGKDCDMCHSVHDNTYGKFMRVPRSRTAGKTDTQTWCQTCHTGATMDPDAAYLGDHFQGSHHPYKGSGWINRSCWGCHEEHGADPYTPSSGPITHPILTVRGVESGIRANDNDSICEACHADVKQNSGGNKHPANMTTTGTWGKVPCKTCHDVHQPDQSGRPAILRDQNVDSGYCMECHHEVDTSLGPSVGDSHPVNVPLQNPPVNPSLTPVGNTIDDNGLRGIDYPSNSSEMVCETCHSVHRKGVAHPLLRMTYDNSALCLNCHNV